MKIPQLPWLVYCELLWNKGCPHDHELALGIFSVRTWSTSNTFCGQKYTSITTLRWCSGGLTVPGTPLGFIDCFHTYLNACIIIEQHHRIRISVGKKTVLYTKRISFIDNRRLTQQHTGLPETMTDEDGQAQVQFLEEPLHDDIVGLVQSSEKWKNSLIANKVLFYGRFSFVQSRTEFLFS